MPRPLLAYQHSKGPARRPNTRTIYIACSEETAALWRFVLFMAQCDDCTMTAGKLLHRMMLAERKRMSARHDLGWIELVERRYGEAFPTRTTTAPPPTPQTFVD